MVTLEKFKFQNIFKIKFVHLKKKKKKRTGNHVLGFPLFAKWGN